MLYTYYIQNISEVIGNYSCNIMSAAISVTPVGT